MKYRLQFIHFFLYIFMVFIPHAYADNDTQTIIAKTYIGATRNELINCLGTPSRQIISHDKQYLFYINESHCQAAFVLQEGIVEKIFYTGKHGKKLDASQCPFAMQECNLKSFQAKK